MGRKRRRERGSGEKSEDAVKGRDDAWPDQIGRLHPSRIRDSWNFIPRGKRGKVHTRLGLETIKVSGIDLKRRELARASPPGEEENARGSVW